MSEQQEVYQAVVRRGYREGWSRKQWLARQCIKLLEEVGEFARAITTPEGAPADLWMALWLAEEAGRYARRAFDNANAWEGVTVDEAEYMAELADVQVVLFAAAGETGRDLPRAAAAKARADVERGVR